MKSDVWDRVQSIFLKALDLKEGSRLQYVLEESKGNGEIYEAVIGMLEADKDTPSYLENPPKWAQTFNPSINTIISHYQIIEEIGRGGMGQVYRALDLDTGDHVALKMVQGASYSPRLLKRFMLEQRVMARLNHPHIARLIEVGFVEEDMPYLVMEYVQGQHIVTFCETHNLSLFKRLVLIQHVCSAIHYAHQNRVVHRDLKPSNIFVTPEGFVKVLDFGIAKLMEETEGFGALTRTGEKILTPAYAAPEQLSGDPVTPATDIYTIGLLMYEVITGDRRKPGSKSVSLEDGLQQIVTTALQPNPSNRFNTAKEFERAIGSYLDRSTDV